MNGRLLRILGTGFGLAVIFGATVGGEILRLPGGVARLLPRLDHQLLAWGLGGLYALLCASLFAELATRVPRSGGLTAFAGEGLGPFAGFLVGWGDFLASAFTVGAYGLLAGTLLAERLPGPPRAWAAVTILGVGVAQWPRMRWAAWVQDATSLLKGLLLAALALGGLWIAPSLPEVGIPPRPGLLAGVAALQLVVFAYDNYYGAVYFGEEYTEPGRQLPRSLLGGTTLVLGIYLLLAWGMGRGLDLHTLTTSELPGADLAGRLLGPGGARAVWGLMLLSLLSGMNATLLIASRILLALGREGEAWAGATTVNAGGTPVTGLLWALGLALAGLALPSFETAIAFMSPFVLVNYGLCFLALLRLRSGAASPAPFHAPGLPATGLLAILVSLTLLVGGILASPALSGSALALMAMAWPLHWSLGRSRSS